MEYYHKTHGVLKPAGKKHKHLGNKVVDLYEDEKGNKVELDGTETPMEEMMNSQIQEETKQEETQKEQKTQELSDEMDFEKNISDYEEKEAREEEKLIRHTEVIKEVKQASESIVEAVKSIPETVIPEVKIPDHFKEHEKWKNAILEALKIEIPEVDLEPVIKAINNIKFPEIPQPIDYTTLLKEIKKSLSKDIDFSGVIEAVKNIPQPEKIPFEFSEGRLKVEVDRVSLGGGGGAGIATEAKQDDIISAINGNYDTVEVNKTAYPTITVVKKLSGATISTKTVQIIG